MVILKKIKSSTLIETMVATVLIVVLFMMASLLLNTIFASSVSGNKNEISTHLQALEYQYKNGTITIPYYEDLEEWNITMQPENFRGTTYIVLEVTHVKTKQQFKTYSTLAE